jgi:hypothetical protein
MHLFPHRGHADTVAPFALLVRWRTPVVDEVAAFVRSVAAEPKAGFATPDKCNGVR